MRVKELRLHNFRGIKDLNLVFDTTNHSVVILVGINGVGKSSILDCINLSIQYYGKICAEYILFGMIPTAVNSGIMASDVNIDNGYTSNHIKANLVTGKNVSWELFGAKEYNDGEEYAHKSIDENSINNIIDAGCEQLVDRYFYYLSNRRVVDSKNTGTTKANNIVDFKSFSIWFKETEDLENERRLSDNIEYRHPVLESVRWAVYSLLGESYDSLKFKREIDRMTIKKLGREINVELLSDGEKSLLAMVGHLSRRLSEDHDNLDNPLEASALVLIDEIELHLHPEWQRMIILRLTKTFPNCQFIITTHSPQVLSHVDPECIHILDYDGDNVIVKRPESSYGLDSNRILEDILGVSKRPQEIQERMLELLITTT
jgi:predicted ATP-binding protein involved in virulence